MQMNDQPKLHPLIEGECRQIAQALRRDNPGVTLRNATVFSACIKEFSRHRYIELVGGEYAFPKWIPSFYKKSLARARDRAMWVPGRNFPAYDEWLCNVLVPSLRDGALVWTHKPPRRSWLECL